MLWRDDARTSDSHFKQRRETPKAQTKNEKPGRLAGVFVSVLGGKQSLCVIFRGTPQAAHHDHRHPEQERHEGVLGLCRGELTR